MARTLVLALTGLFFGCNGQFSAPSGELEPDAGEPMVIEPEPDAGARQEPERRPPRDEVTPPSQVDVGSVDVSSRGPLAAATTHTTLLLAGESNPVGVRLWYPAVKAAAAEAEQARPITALETNREVRTQLSGLLDSAPEGCVTREMHVAINAKARPNAGQWPVVLFVPCEGCPSYAAFSVAEHLASWGIVVAAEDSPTWLDTEQPVAPEPGVREAHLLALLDGLFEAPAAALPSGLSGKLDVSRVGIWGHGQGATLATRAFESDARATAWVLIAPTPTGVEPEILAVGNGSARSLFMLAREDNVLTEADNIAARMSFAQATAESWLLEVSDAGHYTFSDLAGLTATLAPGCGPGERQSSTGPFTYLDHEVAMSLTRSYVLAYFARELLGDDVAREYLKAPRPKGVVTLAHHE